MQDDTQETSDEHRLIAHPLVSVLMITYNHAQYLAAAIDGVIGQECDFPFELIIGEDASSDATREVALAYQKRYPELVRVVHSPRNVGMNTNSRRIFARARGKYVAYCEGDDFWYARNKLARQVELLERDDRIGIVHTDWTRATLQDGTWQYDITKSVHRRVPTKYLSGYIFRSWHYPRILRTCTILVRKQAMTDWYQSGLMRDEYLFGDSALSAWVTSRWQVGYIPAVMAVYRVSPNSALRSGATARVALYRCALQFDTAARAYFGAGAGYPQGYRWECAVSLMIWGLRARDGAATRDALHDLRQHFGVRSFLCSGWSVIAMRLPSIRRQPSETAPAVLVRAAHS